MNTPPLAVPVAQVTVVAGGMAVVPQFIGAAPGQVAGIVQIDLQLPNIAYSSSPITVLGAPVYISQ